MKKYYVIRAGENIALGCGDSLGGEEVTEQEYNNLLTEVRAKTAYVSKLDTGEITIEDVPAEWQAEVRHRVEARIAAEAEAEENAEATIEDYQRALAELGVVL